MTSVLSPGARDAAHDQGRRGARAPQGWPSATASGGFGLDPRAPLGGLAAVRSTAGSGLAPRARLAPHRPDKPRPPKQETRNAQKAA
jgi:hypothetical protein